MARRRILYIALLIGAAVYHIAYGQYLTYYMLLFLLCLPALSLVISLPAALLSKVELYGGADVLRNTEGKVRLELSCKFILPPEAWLIKLEEQNLFTEKSASKQVIRINGTKKLTKLFVTDTSRLGTVRYRIKKACVYDYLGLFPIRVKRSGSVTLTVLPAAERPMPVPDLHDTANIVFKPKPAGFSEEHELRPYRGGDPLNLIHWKLSSKYDDVIVREPQELVRRKVVLSVDLPDIYAAQQSVIEQLRFLNDMLLESEIPYRLIFGLQTLSINSDDDFNSFIKAVLMKPMRVQPALSETAGGDALVYRIRPADGI